MPKVTIETLTHVARLAQLSLTAEERELFSRQLQDVLAYAERLQGVDTEAVLPMSHARVSEILREDEPTGGLASEVALAQAPDAANGLFRVPRVIGG